MKPLVVVTSCVALCRSVICFVPFPLPILVIPHFSSFTSCLRFLSLVLFCSIGMINNSCAVHYSYTLPSNLTLFTAESPEFKNRCGAGLVILKEENWGPLSWRVALWRWVSLTQSPCLFCTPTRCVKRGEDLDGASSLEKAFVGWVSELHSNISECIICGLLVALQPLF